MTLTINPSIATSIDRLSLDPPHALLLSGTDGVGLDSVARQLAGSHLEARLTPQTKTGDYDVTSGSISVDAIRQLYQQLSTKTTGARVVILDDADRMTIAAQNAFLKLLEEPPERTRFILTSHTPRQLLPTIRSRTQELTIPTVTAAQSRNLIDAAGVTDPTKLQQLLFIAEGLPAELTRLIEDDTYFATKSALYGKARDFLGGSVYQKMVIISTTQTRTDALQFIEAILIVARTMVSRRPQAALVQQIERLLTTHELIAAGGNIRLQFLRAVL